MTETRYKIDRYSIEFFAVDRKGNRRRWGDRVLKLFSDGRLVAQAVFSSQVKDIPEPYMADGKIYYFAHSDQVSELLKMLQTAHAAYIAWKPVHDPREFNDGDAVFIFEAEEG